MKYLSLLAPIFAAATLFTQPAFADAANRHEKCAHMALGEVAVPARKTHGHESMMQESIEKMHAQMATIKQTKNPKKRQKLLQEHNKSMRDSIKMMREMISGTSMGCDMGSDHGMCDHKMSGSKMCDHNKSSNPVSKPDVKADASPVAQAGSDPITAADKISPNAEKIVWTCPMHPDVIRDQPGACPFCGMDLVEMEQSDTPQSEHSHVMGGGMKDECMMGGGMKGECMMGGGMKGECMMGGGMKGECMMGGGMKGPMMNMANKHMQLMLILMEQMLEHNEARMAVKK